MIDLRPASALRLLGGRDPYRQVTQFSAMWQAFEATRSGVD